MEHLSRDTILTGMTDTFEGKMEQYDLDEIGIFEEQGEGDLYYIGYRVKKGDNVYMIHQAYHKSEDGLVIPGQDHWVIESEAGDNGVFGTLDEAFQEISELRH
ncbi:MAG: DUF5634 family protein [Bacillus sp. (in: Bacteria)]|nr:DUF5634 family protein [Bacillus sp. (in: firmicutes)]